MLAKYYSFNECEDIPSVLRHLKKLEKDGLIYYKYDKLNDILTLEDLDMSDDDIETLLEVFEQKNVLEDSDGTTDDDYYKDGDDNDDYSDFHSHY